MPEKKIFLNCPIWLKNSNFEQFCVHINCMYLTEKQTSKQISCLLMVLLTIPHNKLP